MTDVCMDTALWGLNESHLLSLRDPGSAKEKGVYLDGQMGMREQKKGVVDILGGELKLTSRMGDME